MPLQDGDRFSLGSADVRRKSRPDQPGMFLRLANPQFFVGLLELDHHHGTVAVEVPINAVLPTNIPNLAGLPPVGLGPNTGFLFGISLQDPLLEIPILGHLIPGYA